MRWLRDAPIATKVMTLPLASAAVLILACVLFLISEYFALKTTLTDNLDALTAVVADNSVAAMTFDDPETAERTLLSLHTVPDIELACLYSRSGDAPWKLFAEYHAVGHQCPGLHTTHASLGSLEAHLPVRFAGETIGELVVVRGLRGLRRLLAAQALIAVMCLAVGLALIVMLVPLARRMLVVPVLRLASTVRRVTLTRNYDLRVSGFGKDELGELAADFNAMMETIKESQSALEQEIEERARANAELSDALNHNLALKLAMEELEAAQAQLVEAEKMASLGTLVAGVAHEINNPVGIGVTAASQLLHEVQEISHAYSAGTLKASTLKARLGSAENMANVTLTHLRRAAELVASFKRVAIDQSTDDCQTFELSEYLHEIMRSLLPQLKKTPHSLGLDAPQVVRMRSYPGAISQVVTNLVINALRHAFPDEHSGGHIHIHAHADSRHATIVVSDDGAGIPPEYQTEVFEPFFTTQRGRGGSGLGLSVVFNLVTHKLGGTVKVRSTMNKGTTFIVTIPLDAPKQ